MRILIYGLGAALAILLVTMAVRDLLPPRHIVLAAGPEGGGYARIAEEYRAILARDRIEVEVRHTAGSVENAALFEAGEIDVALLQGGIDAPAGVASLAAVFVEPLFAFARTDDDIVHNPGLWTGLRLATGGPGSGTAAAVDALFTAAGLPESFAEREPLGGAAAAEALRAGKVDGALFVAPLSAPYIEDLLVDPEVTLVQLRFVDAISRRLQQSRVVRLPAGSISLEPTVPLEDVRLIAMIARLSARDDLHPALVDRLVEAAREIHSDRDALTDEGRYPNLTGLVLPLDPYARNLLQSGPSPLQQYVPFWVAAQINRVVLLAVPLLFLLIPLLRAAPGVYNWQMRARVWRYYTSIRELDEAARETEDRETLAALLDRLDRLDRDVAALRLPARYRDSAFTTRVHIDLVRRRIAERLGRA